MPAAAIQPIHQAATTQSFSETHRAYATACGSKERRDTVYADIRCRSVLQSRVQKRSSGLKVDLLNPSKSYEAQLHKKKRLVQGPNSYFMDVKCPGCFSITTVFSHANTVVLCGSCSTVLCQPTGGKARLTEGCSFRRKA